MREGAKRWRDRAEAIAGTTAVFIIGFAPPVLALLFGLAALTNRENAEWLPAWVCFPVCLAAGTLAVWLARVVSRALYACHPELRKLDQTVAGQQTAILTPFDSDEPIERSTLPMAIVAGLSLPRVPLPLAVPLALLVAGPRRGGRADRVVPGRLHRDGVSPRARMGQVGAASCTELRLLVRGEHLPDAGRGPVRAKRSRAANNLETSAAD